jgi:hypothetical protein
MGPARHWLTGVLGGNAAAVAIGVKAPAVIATGDHPSIHPASAQRGSLVGTTIQHRSYTTVGISPEGEALTVQLHRQRLLGLQG